MSVAREIGAVTLAAGLLGACSLGALDGFSGGAPSDAGAAETGAPETGASDAGAVDPYEPEVVSECPSGAACVPVPPFWEAVAMVPSECPDGFSAPLKYVTDVTADPADCSCDCSGSETCSGEVTLAHHAAAGCQGTPSTKTWTVAPTCQFYGDIVEKGHSFKVTTDTYTKKGACTASVKERLPEPSMLSALKCRPEVLCPTGVCLASSAEVCIARSGVAECPSGYSQRRLVAATVTDTRACGSCACASSLTCEVSGVEVQNYNNCDESVPYRFTVTSTCYDFTSPGYTAYAVETLTMDTGTGTCTPSSPSVPTGSVALDPATTETVCCP